VNYCPTCGAPLAAGSNFCTSCGAEVPTRARYSGFWRRAGSLALDGVIVGLPVALVLAPTSLSGVVRGVVEGVVFVVYGGTLVGRRGQTLGMRVAKITCVMADGSLVTPGVAYTRAVVRVALNSVSLLAFAIAPPVTAAAGSVLTTAQMNAEHRFLSYVALLSAPYLLDLLWMLWSPRRQTLHDLAAGTVVVRSEVQVSAPALPPLRP
jgi:uncharacterized RDD family membrane protein YckC